MKYYQDYVLVMSAGVLSIVSTVNVPPACEYRLHIWDSHRNFSLPCASIQLFLLNCIVSLETAV